MKATLDKSMRKLNTGMVIFVAIIFLAAVAGLLNTFAAATPQFSQTINTGTLATDIRDSSRVTVGSPAVAMSAVTTSFSCLSGGSASTGTLGTNDERIYVDNPDGADNGWTLTMAATSGATAVWTDGGSNTYDFNDSTASCGDGADTDLVGGQMTVDPSGGSTTTDYSGSDTTGISLGASNTFVEGTTNSITLVTAANTSADVWRGYFTGVSISQTIPAEQAAAAYTLGFTITVAAS